MCAGRSDRYSKTYPKVLEPILGEPNYKRTIRLLNENGIDNPIITISNEILSHFDYQNKIIGSNEREIDRFRNIRNSFDDKALILYGDVVYHEADIKRILNNLNDEIQFFGSLNDSIKYKTLLFGEILAIYISNKSKFFNAVDTTVAKFDNKIIEREIGLDVFTELQMNDANLIALSEYTDDFDAVEKYIKMKNMYENKII
jgi:NDP-sugar pyrophosphorylase family protein